MPDFRHHPNPNPMTTLPALVDKANRVGVHGYTSEEVYHNLFRQLYPLYGTQGRVINILLTKLHAHVISDPGSAAISPYNPDIRERERHLLDILSGITFGDSVRGVPDSGDNGHEHPTPSPSEAARTDSECDQANQRVEGGIRSHQDQSAA